MTGDEQHWFVEAVDAFRRGDLDTALNSAAQAVAAGSQPEPRHLLGLVWCRLGQPGRGIEPLRAAASARPDDPNYQLILARALIDCGRSDEVLAMPEPAADARAMWLARAEAADRSARPDCAIAAWRAIVAADAADLRARLALARTLAQCDRFDESVPAYEAVLAADPANSVAFAELAMLFERSSRIDRLEALVSAAERSGMADEALAFPRAQLAFREGDISGAKRQRERSGPDSDPVSWYRLKSRIEDRLGNPSEAFSAARAMKLAAPDRDSWRSRARDYRVHLRRQADTLTPEWADRLRPLDPFPGQNPIFLLGFPRSGTTLLDTFLMGHPKVTVVEERPMLVEATQAMANFGALASDNPAELRAARGDYGARLREAQPGGRPVVIDKFPLNLVAAPLIHALFPGAPIIFAKRHPCDPVLSGFMQAFAPNVGMASFLDLADAADFFDAAMALWFRSCEVLPLNVHEIAFEDLVADPEAALRPLVGFLGLNWDPAMLDHRSAAAARGVIPNTSYDQVTEALSLNPVFRWRRYRQQLDPVLPVLLPWAKRLGYIE